MIGKIGKKSIVLVMEGKGGNSFKKRQSREEEEYGGSTASTSGSDPGLLQKFRAVF